jgi:hypothetical protein
VTRKISTSEPSDQSEDQSENRLAIVEELKNLINPQENIKDTLKHFNDLRERWKNAYPIPKDKYNHVWNNYHFHVENFYDYLHLDREARDIDFKHNLEQKQRIISRVEELVIEADISKAFRELQDLHRLWKEEIGRFRASTAKTSGTVLVNLPNRCTTNANCCLRNCAVPNSKI